MSEIMEYVKNRDPHEKEFHQAVNEVMESIKPVLEQNPIYRRARIPERLVEPERVIMFRVPWMDDQGVIQVNRGFRIQMNSAIGPWEGCGSTHQSAWGFSSFWPLSGFKERATLPWAGAGRIGF
jgi:glutamate dehydrogenase (NADP+)